MRLSLGAPLRGHHIKSVSIMAMASATAVKSFDAYRRPKDRCHLYAAGHSTTSQVTFGAVGELVLACMHFDICLSQEASFA